ncbi:unnamed protein product [Chrysoparadoxa australica]
MPGVLNLDLQENEDVTGRRGGRGVNRTSSVPDIDDVGSFPPLSPNGTPRTKAWGGTSEGGLLPKDAQSPTEGIGSTATNTPAEKDGEVHSAFEFAHSPSIQKASSDMPNGESDDVNAELVKACSSGSTFGDTSYESEAQTPVMLEKIGKTKASVWTDGRMTVARLMEMAEEDALHKKAASRHSRALSNYSPKAFFLSSMGSNGSKGQRESINQGNKVPEALRDLQEATAGRPNNEQTSRARSMSPAYTKKLMEGGNMLASPRSPQAPGHHRVGSHKRQRSAFSQILEPELVDKLGTMKLSKAKQEAVNKFNKSPKEGLAFLFEQGLASDDVDGIVNFFTTEVGLSKRKMGEYFGKDAEMNQKVLMAYLHCLDFKRMTLDEALRLTVMKFRMPGEAQQIDRIMEKFAKCYHEDNPNEFNQESTAYIMSFSLMMLNTDLFNRNLKEDAKMTLEQFISNNRGIDDGKDLPPEMLEGMYTRIKTNEIRMDEGDMFESEVITFVAPKMSGWLKKKSGGLISGWKRHWFVLANGVLYYFFAPGDEAPRCIIPLENVRVDKVNKTDLSISVTDDKGCVKSVKMMDDGRMEQGSHKEFVFRAERMDERDKWVGAIQTEIPSAPARMAKNRRRRTSFEENVSVKVPKPSMRGWTRTQQDNTWTHRYCALFKCIGNLPQNNVIYFFGSSEMCDRMVGQRLHTYHGSLALATVEKMELFNMRSESDKTLVMHAGEKTVYITPDDQETFNNWVLNIQECLPALADPAVNETPLEMDGRVRSPHHGVRPPTPHHSGHNIVEV